MVTTFLLLPHTGDGATNASCASEVFTHAGYISRKRPQPQLAAAEAYYHEAIGMVQGWRRCTPLSYLVELHLQAPRCVSPPHAPARLSAPPHLSAPQNFCAAPLAFASSCPFIRTRRHLHPPQADDPPRAIGAALQLLGACGNGSQARGAPPHATLLCAF